jgi:NDP-sugar pyrophosphorylase family protein
MKAMILAAGLGTRLRPLTDDRPKALVEVAGRTLLEIALARLRGFGVSEVIVNAHHFADRIAEYLKANDNFGMRIELSRELELLETGGGLKKAAHFFSDSSEPFILHNVDVISTIDLAYMAKFHAERNALATLAVQQRESARQLLFDEAGLLCGRRAGSDAENEFMHAARDVQALAFCGIHILSPQIFTELSEEGAFSIIAAYLRLAAQGEKIVAFRADDCSWRDLGRPESVRQAAAELDGAAFAE